NLKTRTDRSSALRKSQGQEACVRGRQEERDRGGRRGDTPPTLHQEWRMCRLSDAARGLLLYSIQMMESFSSHYEQFWPPCGSAFLSQLSK
ncbi:hypothetical protein PO909_011990, partial [Leuciscus waleckii]